MNTRLRIVVLLATVAAASVSLQAAELRLRQQCTPQSPLVTLGDIADVFAADAGRANALKQIELFPAPTSDRPRVLRVRELQDIMASRGVNLAEHQFSGSIQVEIAAGKKRAVAEQPLNEQTVKRAQRRLQEAILKYLQEKAPDVRAPILQFETTAAQSRAAASPALPISVRGGTPPWTGTQRFTILIETAEGPSSFPLEVRVSMPASVVAVVHALPRGAIIHAADLILVNDNPSETGAFRTMEEAVGKQTTKAVAEGKVLTSDAVQAPLMVRRGDVVTVYARTAGIRIHTTARAKDDGAMSDLIAVESMADRKSFTARVCGPRETEVFAQAALAE